MLYVRFLSSLSPPLDTFATLSKVYRPSQTPHPAVSSKELGLSSGRPTGAAPRTVPAGLRRFGVTRRSALSSLEAYRGSLLTATDVTRVATDAGRPFLTGAELTAPPERATLKNPHHPDALCLPVGPRRRGRGRPTGGNESPPPVPPAATPRPTDAPGPPRGDKTTDSAASQDETPLTLIHRVSRVATKVGVFHGRGAQGRAREGAGRPGPARGPSRPSPTPHTRPRVDPHSSVLLHPKCHSTGPNWSKAQQGLLAPPISLRPFP